MKPSRSVNAVLCAALCFMLWAYSGKSGDAQVLVTNLSSLSANDQVNWGQLGDGNIAIPPMPFTSNNSLIGTVNETGDPNAISGALFGLQQGSDWPGTTFSNGDNLLWTGVGVNTLQITFNSPISGIGTYVGADYSPNTLPADQFTATLQAFDANNNPLGSFTNSGSTGGSSFFLGVLSATPDITSVTYTTTAGPNAGDFSIDSLYLNYPNNIPPPAVPEPGVWVLLICATLTGAGFLFRCKMISKSWRMASISLVATLMLLHTLPSMASDSLNPLQLQLHSPLAISGHMVSATVTLNPAPLINNAVITLSSDKQNIANVPSNVTILAGQSSSAPFNISTYFVNLPTIVHITATYNNDTSIATLKLYPAPRAGGGGGSFAGLQPFSPWPEAGGNNLRNGQGVGSGATGVGYWAMPTQATVHSSPAIANNGTIYVVGNGLLAFNPNGTRKWAFDANGWQNNGYSSPAIGSDGTVYVCLGASLYAVNPSDGSQKWKFKTNIQNYSIDNSSPIIGANGTIYFGGVDGANPDLNAFYAVSPSGAMIWEDTFLFGGGTQTTPAIGPNGIIYVPQNFGMIAINAQTGSVLWHIKYVDTYVASTVSVGSDGTVYMDTTPGGDFGDTFQNMNNVLFALYPNTGGIKWSFATNVSPSAYDNSAPAIGADGTIYENVPGGWLYAINPADGSQKWALNLSSTQNSSTPPVIGGDGTIYVGSVDYYLYAVSPSESGTLLWSYDTSGNIFSSPAIGADGTIYIGNAALQLLAVH